MGMNKGEARILLATELEDWRSRSYTDLVAMLDQSTNKEVVGDSGVTYQIEIQVFWDAKPQGNLRVLGAIDNRGWSAFSPLCDDFILAPDVSLVGE
jgi:hypothetical protein